MPTRRMKFLADELNQLISKMAIIEELDEAEENEEARQTPSIQDWLDTAEEAYNTRRHREKMFGASHLFGEPAWDILLDLFIAELKNARMQTTSVCIGAQVPQTTALRWIALLEREDLVRRYRDKEDSRRIYIQLTDLALKTMVGVFYDRCFLIMNRNKNQQAKLSQMAPGSNDFDAKREEVMSGTIAQLRIRKPQ